MTKQPTDIRETYRAYLAGRIDFDELMRLTWEDVEAYERREAARHEARPEAASTE